MYDIIVLGIKPNYLFCKLLNVTALFESYTSADKEKLCRCLYCGQAAICSPPVQPHLGIIVIP